MPDYLQARSVTLAASGKVLVAGVEAAHRIDVAVCLAVVDSGGNLTAFQRMDGAPLLSVQIAQDKAFTVAAFSGLPTGEWWRLIAEEPALQAGMVKTHRLIVFGGGVPLYSDGHLIGAVGVSGGSADQDVQVATAAAGALG